MKKTKNKNTDSDIQGLYGYNVSESHNKSQKITEDEKLELERRELGPKNYNRKTRRDYLRRVKVLKSKNHLKPFSKEWYEYYNKTRTEGKRIHDENTEAVRRQQEWYLEKLEENKRKSLTEFYRNIEGISEDEVNKMVEDQMSLWYKSRK